MFKWLNLFKPIKVTIILNFNHEQFFNSSQLGKQIKTFVWDPILNQSQLTIYDTTFRIDNKIWDLDNRSLIIMATLKSYSSRLTNKFNDNPEWTTDILQIL